MFQIPHTYLIILITVLMSMAAWQHRAVMDRLIFNISAIRYGQYDRFLTHGFIHNDGIHLFFNMEALAKLHKQPELTFFEKSCRC